MYIILYYISYRSPRNLQNFVRQQYYSHRYNLTNCDSLHLITIQTGEPVMAPMILRPGGSNNYRGAMGTTWGNRDGPFSICFHSKNSEILQNFFISVMKTQGNAVFFFCVFFFFRGFMYRNSESAVLNTRPVDSNPPVASLYVPFFNPTFCSYTPQQENSLFQGRP